MKYERFAMSSYGMVLFKTFYLMAAGNSGARLAYESHGLVRAKPAPLLKQMETANKMLVEYAMYSGGKEVVMFDLAACSTATTL